MTQTKSCKTYRGETANEALLKVKMDIGEQAEIVETRRIEEGGFFGFFSQSFVEVDAYLPSSGNARPTEPRGRGSVDTTTQPETHRRSSPNENHTNEWTIDEDTADVISTREEAKRRIRERLRQTTSADTYERPGNGDGPSRGSKGEAEPPTPRADADSATMSQLLKTTNRLADSLEDFRENMDQQAPGPSSGGVSFPGNLQEVYQSLTHREVRPEWARDLMNRVQDKLTPGELDRTEPVHAQLKEEIKQDFQPPPTLVDPERDHMLLVPLIGPTGVGKTTTIAKLAAHFSMEENQQVGFISMDGYRLAAVEQLRCYADILQIPMQDVTRKDEFKNAVDRMSDRGVDLVYVDTGGCSQFDEQKLDALRNLFSSMKDLKNHLVVSATTQNEDLDTILEGFDRVGYDRLVVTKLDETVCHGMVYNLMRSNDCPIAYFTDGQDVPDDLWMADPDRVASLLVEGMEDHE